MVASELWLLGVFCFLIVGKAIDQFYEVDAEMLSDCRY